MNNISKVLQKLIYKEKRKQYLVFLRIQENFFQETDYSTIYFNYCERICKE